VPPDDPLSTLDRISLWMDAPERRLDFLIAIALSSIEKIAEIDDRHARAIFPRASSIAAGDHWLKTDPSPIVHTTREEALATFAQAPLDPHAAPLVRQWICGRELLTQSHHGGADLMSILLFVAAELDREATADPLALRTHERPQRKSRYAQPGPSTRLWSRRSTPSGERHHRRFVIEAGPWRSAIEKQPGFTYNDALGLAALSAVRHFQESRSAATKALSLWLPVSLRVDPHRGFGNGSSRIRVYEAALEGVRFADRARSFRAQVAWSKEHGEWAVPTKHPLLGLPAKLQQPVLKAYLRRPWVDMGTIMFSHLERLPEGIGDVDSVEVIATLDRRHPAGLVAATIGDRTHFTLTWDPAQLDPADAEELIAHYQAALATGLAEL
jgi:hypothetical protein